MGRHAGLFCGVPRIRVARRHPGTTGSQSAARVGWQQHPEWVAARSCTPSVLGWAADTAPSCRVPRSPCVRVPYSRTRIVFLGVLQAVSPRRVGCAPESAPPPRRRGACSFWFHQGHWVWECRAQSLEWRAHGGALHEAFTAHRSGWGPASPRPLNLGAGPPVMPTPPAVSASGSAPPGTVAFTHAVETDDCVYLDAAAHAGGSSSEEWPAGGEKTGYENGRPCHTQRDLYEAAR